MRAVSVFRFRMVLPARRINMFVVYQRACVNVRVRVSLAQAHFPPFRRSYLLSRMTTPPQLHVYLVLREIKDGVSNGCCGSYVFIISSCQLKYRVCAVCVYVCVRVWVAHAHFPSITADTCESAHLKLVLQFVSNTSPERNASLAWIRCVARNEGRRKTSFFA